MQSEHAVVGPAMRRDALARLQYREHGGREPGDALYDSPRLWTQIDVWLRSYPVGEQREDLPGGIARENGCVDGDLLDVRQVGLADQDAVELAANDSPLA